MVALRPSRTAWAGGALVALATLASVLVPAGPLAVDRSWSEAMADIRTRPLTDLARVLDWLGRFPGSLVAIAAVAAVLLAARRRLALLAFVLAECLAPLVTAALKSLGGRPRPPAGLVHAGGFSFPSGHAAYAGVTCAAAVLLFSAPVWRRRSWALATVGIVGMAWSRTYLQVHWLSDVVAGAAVGIGVALLVLGVTGESAGGKPPRLRPLRPDGAPAAPRARPAARSRASAGGGRARPGTTRSPGRGSGAAPAGRGSG